MVSSKIRSSSHSSSRLALSYLKRVPRPGRAASLQRQRPESRLFSGTSKMSKGKYSHLPLAVDRPLYCPYVVRCLFIGLQHLRFHTSTDADQGKEVLHTPLYNKGTAFSHRERHDFDLYGFLPTNIQTLEEQARRAYDQYSSRRDDLAKNTFMTSMQEQNTVLYYQLIQNHLKEMFSVIYTPTEGEAIENYSRLFRKSEGCFLNIDDVGQVEMRMAKFGSADDIDYIVVSDGEQILGIGDQGIGGILISAAKLVLTTVCAGIHPNRTLPVVLDTGTNNDKLLNDELYLGLKKARVRGDRYDEFVDKFIQAARKLYPKAYIHFEDFALPNARRLLDKYRPDYAVFNDDVQGTGCVTLAAIMAGLHVSKLKLTDVRMVVYGAGTAGTGIAEQVRDAIAAESEKSKEEATKQIW